MISLKSPSISNELMFYKANSIKPAWKYPIMTSDLTWFYVALFLGYGWSMKCWISGVTMLCVDFNAIKHA